MHVDQPPQSCPPIYDPQAASSQQKQEYSCARCRRLKKKCTKEIPICSLCFRVKAKCDYPGRAARRTKKELKAAMERGEFVPQKRRKKSSKNTSPLASLSVTPEDMSTANSPKSQPPPTTITNVHTSNINNVINNINKSDSNVSLPSLNALYNDVYSHSMKSISTVIATRNNSLPGSTTATVATTPPLTNPNIDAPLYESVSSLISSLATTPQPTDNTTSIKQEDTTANMTNEISSANGKVVDRIIENLSDLPSTKTKTETSILVPSLVSPVQTVESPGTKLKQTEVSSLTKAASLPSLPATSPQYIPNHIDIIGKFNPGSPLTNKMSQSTSSLVNLRLSNISSIIETGVPLPNDNVHPETSTTTHTNITNNNDPLTNKVDEAITPQTNEHKPSSSLPMEVDVSQLDKGITTTPTPNISNPTTTTLEKSITTAEALAENEASCKIPYNMEKVDSVPITSASIEIATIGNVFKGGRVGTWVNEDGTYKEIDRNLLDRFIAAYFRHNHRLFPMIDKTSFLNKISSIDSFDFEKLNKVYDDVFIFKIYMIMAIGCTTLRRAGMLLKDEEELSEHLAFLAMKKFCYIMNLQNVQTIRCLLLLGIYSFFEPKGWSSWTISGIIMRLTIGLGLNRDLVAKKMRNMTVLQVEARYRVFWSAYCFERLIATCLGRASAIDDDDITVPVPRPLNEYEKDDIDVTNTMIRLRRLAGRIYKQVHSTSVSKKKLTTEERIEIIKGLRRELETVFETEKLKMKQHNDQTVHTQITNTISFHSSDIWLAMRHSQLMILLYRPSVLIPKPPIESLSVLGQYCLEAWKHTYTLYQKKLLPLNWITLFRTLTICNLILFCLCQWTIDLIESKIEIQQCAEILEHFGSKWVFAKKCSEVFRNIGNTILEISLSDGKVPNMYKLTTELFGANDAYHEILDENNVDVSWVDKLM